MGRVTRDLGLFSISTNVPDGFLYRPSFISEPEEHELIGEIQKIDLAPFKYYQFKGSGEQLALVGSTSLEGVTSHQRGICRHFFYHSGDAQDSSSTLIRTA